MASETELKLRVCCSEKGNLGVELLRTLPVKAFSSAVLINRYFDTPSLELNRRKVALRVRQKGERHIQTLKTKGQALNGLHQRGEWEWELSGSALNPALLSDCEAWPKDVDETTLTEVFQTNFERHQATFEWGEAVIELALDQGSILVPQEAKAEPASGTIEDSIYEIELELVSGDVSGILELGRVLQSEFELEVYDQSKAERGYALFLSSRA